MVTAFLFKVYIFSPVIQTGKFRGRFTNIYRMGYLWVGTFLHQISQETLTNSDDLNQGRFDSELNHWTRQECATFRWGGAESQCKVSMCCFAYPIKSTFENHGALHWLGTTSTPLLLVDAEIWPIVVGGVLAMAGGCVNWLTAVGLSKLLLYLMRKVLLIHYTAIQVSFIYTGQWEPNVPADALSVWAWLEQTYSPDPVLNQAHQYSLITNI